MTCTCRNTQGILLNASSLTTTNAVSSEFVRCLIKPNQNVSHNYTTTTTTPINGLFSRTTWVSRYQKGKTNLDLNEPRDDEVLGCSGISWTMQTICTSVHTDNPPTPHHSIFYRPESLPDAQLTVSKH